MSSRAAASRSIGWSVSNGLWNGSTDMRHKMDMKLVKSTKLYGAARANKQEVMRFAKFMVVGFSGLIVDYTVLNVLAHIFNVESWLAVAVAFTVAATNNFIWNRLWVYPESRKDSLWKTFPHLLRGECSRVGN